MKHNSDTINWLTLADKDYCAARCLFLNNFIVQGVILSSTAIEKYLKTILSIQGCSPKKIKSFKHNPSLLFQEVVKTNELLSINQGYLNLLSECYKMRYPDDLPVGFKVGFSTIKMLTELDHTVYKLRSGFSFKPITGKKITTWFDSLIESNDDNLLHSNCYYGSSDREKLFKPNSYCYDMQVSDRLGILEAYYEAQVNDDEKFTLPLT